MELSTLKYTHLNFICLTTSKHVVFNITPHTYIINYNILISRCTLHILRIKYQPLLSIIYNIGIVRLGCTYSSRIAPMTRIIYFKWKYEIQRNRNKLKTCSQYNSNRLARKLQFILLEYVQCSPINYRAVSYDRCGEVVADWPRRRMHRCRQ